MDNPAFNGEGKSTQKPTIVTSDIELELKDSKTKVYKIRFISITCFKIRIENL